MERAGTIMSATSILDTVFHGRLKTASRRLFWLGLAMSLLGIAALIFPAISTLTAALFAGWMLFLFGVIVFSGAFSIHGTGPFFGAMLLGLLSIAAGAFLIFNPLAGAVALTLVIGLLLMLQGTSEIYFAFEMRPHTGWSAMLLSGLASALVALLIVAGWPGISLIALGVLLGVNFLSTGLGYIFISRALKPSA